jgi:hypothetical protein
VTDSFYGVHGELEGDVRFVFESLTGMQELWGGEDDLIHFYSHSCPRLYELNTIAYWIMEKKAHSTRLRAQINQIAQVAIDLSVKRGTTSLTILKAEKRSLENQNKPHRYWVKDLTVSFETEKHTTGQIDLGMRLKELRMKRGLSPNGTGQNGWGNAQYDQPGRKPPHLPFSAGAAQNGGSAFSGNQFFFQEKSDLGRQVVFPAVGRLMLNFRNCRPTVWTPNCWPLWILTAKRNRILSRFHRRRPCRLIFSSIRVKRWGMCWRVNCS